MRAIPARGSLGDYTVSVLTEIALFVLTCVVTLADLFGSDIARTAFEPKLKEMRERWGHSTFTGTKRAYEERRTRETLK